MKKWKVCKTTWSVDESLTAAQHVTLLTYVVNIHRIASTCFLSPYQDLSLLFFIENCCKRSLSSGKMDQTGFIWQKRMFLLCPEGSKCSSVPVMGRGGTAEKQNVSSESKYVHAK